MGDIHRGVCFLKDEKTMKVCDVADSPYNYMDISNFPTNYFSPGRTDKWKVVCVVYDTTSGKSSLWVYHGKIRGLHVVYPWHIEFISSSCSF